MRHIAIQWVVVAKRSIFKVETQPRVVRIEKPETKFFRLPAPLNHLTSIVESLSLRAHVSSAESDLIHYAV